MVLAAEPGALCGCRGSRVSSLGVPLCVWGAGDLGERSQIDFIIMKAAIECHSLGGVVGLRDLQQQREEKKDCGDPLCKTWSQYPERHGQVLLSCLSRMTPRTASPSAWWEILLPDANVTCIIPDDCILPCSFRPTGTVVIHWYKQQIPVHSYYYNKDQFGLQNKHFSGRTCLFNSHIPHGNASLLLRKVKVQDKGRYKCYTSTRKGNQELFVNLEVKALIHSVVMEMTEETVSCYSHNIYPVPQVTWATDPPSAQEALENSTIRTTDHKGLFTVVSTLRIVGNLSNITYFCSFISADRTQVWTASWKNQEDIMHEEGCGLSIPCTAPHNLQNFSLTWTFTSSRESTTILKYDIKTRHTFNLWEGEATLDQDLLYLGDGSLFLHKPDIEEHTGMYTCTFTGLQSKHIVQTRVNITVSSVSVDEQRVRRSWWSTAASVAFVLFTIAVALPQCVRQRGMETRNAPHRHNGAGFFEGGSQKDINTAASYIIRRHGAECDRLQIEAQSEVAGSLPNTAEVCSEDLPATEIEQEEKTAGPPEEGNDEEGDGFENTEPGNHLP